MRFSKNFLSAVLAAVLAALSVPAWAQEPGLAPLEVSEKGIIAALRDQKVLMLVDVFAHKSALLALPPEQVEPLLIATASHYAKQTLDSGKFDAAINDVDVIVAMVENMDEYNRPNFGGMVRIGTVSLRRADGAMTVIGETLDPALVK